MYDLERVLSGGKTEGSQYGNIYIYVRLRLLEDRNSFIMRSESAFASFKVSINGIVASAVYDFELAESSISLYFCTVNHIYTRHGACNTSVTVEISTGGTFTCAIRLRMIYESESLDRPYDVILGRDWFKFCSTGLKDNPDAAVRLSSPKQWLVFSASPINAIQSHTQFSFPTSSEFFISFWVSYSKYLISV